MTEKELAVKLKAMYETPGANRIAMVNLFGVLYANEISNPNISLNSIIKIAEMKPSLATEVRKGIRLSKYVEPKQGF